ncbi:MAG TPA: TetR/AcrR family transcriptional regulator [Bacteroidota bacterium]|nr:TetR/AcrR family transcriptional regulator [Bacteroidota bacterium]
MIEPSAELKITENDPEVRARILAAARDQFFNSGFSRVTVDDIAAKLGMSKKTLYKYFQSKEEMASEVARVVMREMDNSCKALMNDASIDFVEKLRRMMTSTALEYSKMGRTLIEDLQKHAPQLWKEISDFRSKAILANFGNLLKEGMEQGVFRKDIDRDLVMTIYLNSIEHMLTPHVLMALPYSAAQVYEAIVKIMFEGILTDKAKPRNVFA